MSDWFKSLDFKTNESTFENVDNFSLFNLASNTKQFTGLLAAWIANEIPGAHYL